MIADPATFSPGKLDAWLGELRYQGLIDELVIRIAAKTPAARAMMERWTASDDEWVGRAGWVLLNQLAVDEGSTLPDAFFEERLAMIEATIHAAKNRSRQAMNLAMVAVGARNARLRKLATAAAKRAGPIEVDHGDTSCKTVDAAATIEKVWARKAKAAPAVKAASRRK